jgi:hypothetical protein
VNGAVPALELVLCLNLAWPCLFCMRVLVRVHPVQLSDIVLSTLSHVLSPGQLVADIKGLLMDFPSLW